MKDRNRRAEASTQSILQYRLFAIDHSFYNYTTKYGSSERSFRHFHWEGPALLRTMARAQALLMLRSGEYSRLRAKKLEEKRNKIVEKIIAFNKNICLSRIN